MIAHDGCEQYRSQVAKYNGWNVDTMLAIMKAESQCNPLAYNGNTNGTNDKGLFQINSIHVTSGLIGDIQRTDPTLNIEAAHKIWKGSGYTAWSSFCNESYKKFL